MNQPVPDRSGWVERYTQINILFPSNEAELPPAERLKAFPVEAQRAILASFEREQQERHAWLKTQQANDHELNLLSLRHFFWWRTTGTLLGGILAALVIGLGAWLVSKGASATGVAMMISAAAVVIGSAVYGHVENKRTEAGPPAEGSNKEMSPQQQKS